MTADSDISVQANRSKPPRLATLMVSFAGLTVAITAMLLLTLVDHFAIRHANQEAQLRLEQLSWQMRDSLDHTLDQAVRDVHLLSSLPTILRIDNAATARKIIEKLQSQYRDYAWIGVARPKGTILAATGGMLENGDVTARPWFQKGQKAVVAEDYHPAVLLGKLLPQTADPWRFVDVAGPIRDSHGVLLGVLAIHLSWDWARNLARNLLTPALRDYGAEILVVRGDGTVLLGPKDILEQRIATDSLRLALQGRTGAVLERWPDGKTYMTGYSLTGRSGDPTTLRWAILVRQTERTALASAHAFERRALWFSLGLALLLAACAALLARRIVRPLNVLSHAIEGIVHAPAPARAAATGIPQVHSVHEVQVLSEALRDLMRSERGHREALETMNAQLEETVAERTAELQQLLMRDALTGLPNRRALMQTLPAVMARAARLAQPCAVMFLDMDGFKAINDTRGHEEGDELLRQFGARIQESIRETDLAVRLAGDEFVVILDMVTDQAQAEHKARFLLAQLGRPFILHGGGVQVGASIGLALQWPHETQDATCLLTRADQAMYEAKRKGKNRVAVSASLPVPATASVALS
jgi:diguanylate cyclase (GGDEF)-like protein